VRAATVATKRRRARPDRFGAGEHVSGATAAVTSDIPGSGSNRHDAVGVWGDQSVRRRRSNVRCINARALSLENQPSRMGSAPGGRWKSRDKCCATWNAADSGVTYAFGGGGSGASVSAIGSSVCDAWTACTITVAGRCMVTIAGSATVAHPGMAGQQFVPAELSHGP